MHYFLCALRVKVKAKITLLQVVPSIVVLLCNVVKLYKEQKDNVSFAVLQNGVYLLHQMYQHELNFTRRHLSVQPQYVVLISHLSRIFKLAGAEKYDNEGEQMHKLFEHKIVNISLPISFDKYFGCSKEPSH